MKYSPESPYVGRARLRRESTHHPSGSRLRRLHVTSRILAGSVIALVLVGCSDSPPTHPEDPNSIEIQIRTLFQPDAVARDAALSQLTGIRQQIAAGATANARSRALTLVDFAMTSLREGRLAGGTSAAAGNGAARLVDALYQLVGLDPPRLPEGSLSNDGTAQVVGPAGGQVVTPSGAAGVQIPPGALDQQVLVAVTRLPTTPTPGTGPLPTNLRQYPPFYDFATYPNVPQFGDSMRVGVCQVTDAASPFYPPEPHDRLRLAHAVGSAIEILERVGVNDFLRCSSVSASILPLDSRFRYAGWMNSLAWIIGEGVELVRPRKLYAAHGGLGGKVKSFSPFGAVAVDPPAITTQPADQTVAAGTAATLSVTASGSEPLTYRWQRDGTNIVGANARNYTIQAVTRADSLAAFTATVSNAAGSVTSRAARLNVTGATVYGLSGFRPIYPAGPNDLIAVRYRFKVIENQAPTIHILYTFNNLHRPGSSLGYNIETNVYSNRLAYSEDGCTTLVGTIAEGQASLRVAMADYAVESGQQPGPSIGIRTGDPVVYPVQTYVMFNLPKLYKSDAISQFDITGLETQVTIERGNTLTEVSEFTRCGRSLIPVVYRRWSARVEMAGRNPVTVEFIAPDGNALYLNTNQALNVATDFLNVAGLVTVQYWDFAGMRESDPVWRSLSSFVSNTLYDGNGRDFGVRIVNVGGQNRIEVSNRTGNTYFLSGVSFSY